MDNFNLFIIYSSENCYEILKSLHSYKHDDNEIGPIRNDFKRHIETSHYMESNRKIVLLKNTIFERLKNKGLNQKNNFDFRITSYKIRSDNYPPKDSLFYFFFIDKDENQKIVENKLSYFSFIGFLEKKDWIIENGVCFFTENVPILIRIKIKIIIDDIEDGFRVSWCKKKYFDKLKEKFIIN